MVYYMWACLQLRGLVNVPSKLCNQRIRMLAKLCRHTWTISALECRNPQRQLLTRLDGHALHTACLSCAISPHLSSAFTFVIIQTRLNRCPMLSVYDTDLIGDHPWRPSHTTLTLSSSRSSSPLEDFQSFSMMRSKSLPRSEYSLIIMFCSVMLRLRLQR